MQTPEGITIIPTSYQDVIALLKSDALTEVEKSIALRCRMKLIYDFGSASTSSTQSKISVSGMTSSQIESYLCSNKESVIEFGVRFHGDADATAEEQEYPEGEEQDPHEESVCMGYGNGFGILIAIYHNFLSNRTPVELRAFLKNRRIPKQAKFAKDLTRVFAESQTSD